MCGITGLWDRTGTGDASAVIAMRDALSHRGPDAATAWQAAADQADSGMVSALFLDEEKVIEVAAKNSRLRWMQCCEPMPGLATPSSNGQSPDHHTRGWMTGALNLWA